MRRTRKVKANNQHLQLKLWIMRLKSQACRYVEQPTIATKTARFYYVLSQPPHRYLKLINNILPEIKIEKKTLENAYSKVCLFSSTEFPNQENISHLIFVD